MLRNPLYTGRIEIQKWGVSRAGDFDPLIDLVTFDRVQRRLKGRQTEVRGYTRRRPDFALRGTLTCATCRRPLTGSWSKGRSPRYGYYPCPKCVGVRARREIVEELFVEHLELRQDLALADLAFQDAQIESYDVEGILGFAEQLLGNTARIWIEANLVPHRSATGPRGHETGYIVAAARAQRSAVHLFSDSASAMICAGSGGGDPRRRTEPRARSRIPQQPCTEC